MIPGLPQWRCHKVVGAFKIHSIIDEGAGDVLIYPGEAEAQDVPSVAVSREFFRARTSDNSRPLRFPDEYRGGYLVQYEDGYLSWSPAEAFESGYVPITPNLAAPDHGAGE